MNKWPKGLHSNCPLLRVSQVAALSSGSSHLQAAREAVSFPLVREPDSMTIFTVEVSRFLPACCELLFLLATRGSHSLALHYYIALHFYLLSTELTWAGELLWAGCSYNSYLTTHSWHELAAPFCDIQLSPVLIFFLLTCCLPKKIKLSHWARFYIFLT